MSGAVTYFAGRGGVQEELADDRQHRREIARTVNLLLRGQDNSSMSVTLAAGATETVVIDPRISLQTCVTLMPTTADAAAALPTTYVVCEKGKATIYHASSGTTDRTFTLGIQG